MPNYQTTIPRTIGRVLFAILLASACVYHFVEARGFAAMLPSFVPGKLIIVYFTGMVEMLFAFLLFIPSLRQRTGLWIAAYLVLIFPANIYAAIAHIPAPGAEATPTATLWIRLVFQPLLIWWVVWATSEPSPSAAPFPRNVSGS